MSGENALRTREMLIKEAKEILEIISTYKVLKLEQLYSVIQNKELSVKQSIIRILEREKRIFIYDDIASSKEKWTDDFDKGLIIAFWILIDFWNEMLFNTIANFPKKLEFITKDDAYDVIVAEKGDENLINNFFKNYTDNTFKHLVIVQDESQMDKLIFPGIEAFCIVDESGTINYYKEMEG